jgi:hypothetical protein
MITLTKSEFDKIINERLIPTKNDGNDLDRLLEFHKKICNLAYKVDGNLNYFKKNINTYIKSCLPDDFKTLKESHFKFKKLITENRADGNIINEFFDYLGQKINSSVISEQYAQGYGPAAKAAIQPRTQGQVAAQSLKPSQQRKISPEITKYATNITKQLMSALGSGVNDNEEMAVKAIKLINSKECLYEVDRMVKGYKRGKPPYNLQSLINSYMSDYNSAQYRAIWQHLGKFGVTGANYNAFLAGVGKTVEVAGKMVGKLQDMLIKGGVAKVMKMIRDALDSNVGQIIQMVLDETGLGAIGVLGAWGIIVQWDVLMVNQNGIVPLAFSILSLLTANAIGPFLAPLKVLFKTPITKFRDFFAIILKSKFAKWFRGLIPKIVGGLTKAMGWIKTAVTTFVRFLEKVIPGQWGSKFISGMETAFKWLQSFIGDLTGEAAFTNVAKKTAEVLNIPKLTALLDNPAHAKKLAGLNKGVAKTIDDYIVKNNGQSRLNDVSAVFCKSKGPQSPECKATQYLVSVEDLKDKSSKVKQHLVGKNKSDKDLVQDKIRDINQATSDYGVRPDEEQYRTS